jgi:hypothetical protein
MDPMSFLPRLEQLRDRLRQGRPTDILDPSLVEQVKALTADLKGAVQQATAEVHAQAQAAAADLRAKAEAIQKKATAEHAPPAPFPVPWEDHQGLDHARIDELVAALTRGASQRPR